MNPIAEYRKAHPENVVWSPEKGWHDGDEIARWEAEGGQPEPSDTRHTDGQSQRSELLAIVQHLNSGGF